VKACNLGVRSAARAPDDGTRRRRRSFITAVRSLAASAALAATSLFHTAPALATPAHLSTFNAFYPTSQSGNQAQCQLCHIASGGGSSWNAYGNALRASGMNLAAAEAVNSDGVAGNNLQEILASSQPGWCNPATPGCVNPGAPPAVTLDSFTSVEPDILLSPAAVAFGIINPTTSRTTTLTVLNNGQNPLTITATFLQDLAFPALPANAAPSGVLLMTGGNPQTLVIPGGGVHQLQFSFDPAVFTPDYVGQARGTLTIVSNDPDTPTLNVNVTGNSQFPMPTYGCAPGNEVVDPLPPLAKGGIAIGLRKLADGFESPTQAQTAPGHPGRLFVADQKGKIYAIDLATGTKAVFLDVSSASVAGSVLVPVGGATGLGYDERGLLGLAFHPKYAINGLMYIYMSVRADANGDLVVDTPADFSTMAQQNPNNALPNHQSIVVELKVPSPSNALSVPDLASARVLMRMDRPQSNHNGGNLIFDKEGLLYIASGDGGGANDRFVGHTAPGLNTPHGNSQDTSNVLGDILRIDPLGRNSQNGQYGVPSTNPFVRNLIPRPARLGGANGCADGFCDEIFASGIRNTWGMSFDRARDGVLITADVGQNKLEEINIIKAGRNYGWPILEGNHCFAVVPNATNPLASGTGFISDSSYTGARVLTPPVAVYDHHDGLSITGGFVYRGTAIRELRGHYVFGDWALNFAGYVTPQDPADDPRRLGRLFYLATPELEGKPGEKSEVLEFFSVGMAMPIKITAFGQDAAGELYVLGNRKGAPSDTTGSVWKIVPANAP
jgi:glucose/arabinose dehydrogenase